MIKRQMIMRPKGPKLLEARQWAQELKEYFDKKYPQLASEIYTERFGNYLTLHFFSQFETLADLEKNVEEAESDEEYQALFMKGADLLVSDSVRAILLQTL